MNYSSKFQDNWLKMPVFNDWLAKHESPYKAYCKLCVKTIELSNMAKWALTSHAEGKGHQKAVGLKKLHLTKMEQFVKVEKKECAEKDQSEPQNIVTETLTVPLPTETPHKSCLEKPVTSGQCVMSAYVSNEDVMRAEILLTINCSSPKYWNKEEVKYIFCT